MTVHAQSALFSGEGCRIADTKYTPGDSRLELHHNLGALATDAAGQLDVLGHDGHALGVDGGQVGVLEETHQVGLGGLLQRQHRAALEAQVGLEVLGNLTHQPLEGQLADEQLRGLLVLADLAQGDRSRTVPVWFLDATCDRTPASAQCLDRRL